MHFYKHIDETTHLELFTPTSMQTNSPIDQTTSSSHSLSSISLTIQSTYMNLSVSVAKSSTTVTTRWSSMNSISNTMQSISIENQNCIVSFFKLFYNFSLKLSFRHLMYNESTNIFSIKMFYFI